MSITTCKKCGKTMIPDPFDLSSFKCPYCKSKHQTVFDKRDPVAGVG
jgi:Zn finger protein HypA/HybF involved in hydrogenase expression